MPGVPVMAANAAMPTPFGFAAETAMFASSMGMQYVCQQRKTRGGMADAVLNQDTSVIVFFFFFPFFHFLLLLL